MSPLGGGLSGFSLKIGSLLDKEKIGERKDT